MTAIQNSRKQRFLACEKVLTQHGEAFVKVGLALKELRDDRLYEEAGYGDFKSYLKSEANRFGIGERHAHQLIESAELRIKLPTDPADHSTWTERSVRELKRLKSPAIAITVACRVVKEAEANGTKLTLGLVRKHVDEKLGTDRRPKPRPIPEFKEMMHRWTGSLLGIGDLLNSVPIDAMRLFAKEEKYMVKRMSDAVGMIRKGLERMGGEIVPTRFASRKKGEGQ